MSPNLQPAHRKGQAHLLLVTCSVNKSEACASNSYGLPHATAVGYPRSPQPVHRKGQAHLLRVTCSVTKSTACASESHEIPYARAAGFPPSPKPAHGKKNGSTTLARERLVSKDQVCGSRMKRMRRASRTFPSPQGATKPLDPHQLDAG